MKRGGSISKIVAQIALLSIVAACRPPGELRHWENVPTESLQPPASPPSGWQRVPLPKDHCSIAFPTLPKEVSYEQNGFRYHALMSGDGDLTYVLQIAEPAPHTESDFADFAAGAEDSFIETMKAKGVNLVKIPDRYFVLNSKSGRQAVLKSQTHKFMVRTFAGDEKSYILMCGGSASNVDWRAET